MFKNRSGRFPSHDDNVIFVKADETKRNTTLELPYYSKFLLIAAYLASYNSPKTDKRFFLKNAGKIRKRTKAARGPEIKQKMIGPLTFSIDRNCSSYI